MLALFHITEVKMSEYTAIQELLTRDIKIIEDIWVEQLPEPLLWHRIWKDVGKKKDLDFKNSFCSRCSLAAVSENI